MKTNILTGILQGTTLLLTLGVSASAFAFTAETITFDPDGTAGANGDYQIINLDWFPGSTLVLGGAGELTTIEDQQVVESTVQTYSHETLSVMGVVTNEGTLLEETNPIAPNGNSTNMEITFISGFQENVSTTFTIVDTDVDVNGFNVLAVSASSTFTFNSEGDNFFEIYYDDLTDSSNLKSNALTGLGYDDGTQILAGTVSSITDGNFNVTYALNEAGTAVENPGLFQFIDTDGDGKYTPFVDADNSGSWDPGEGDLIYAVNYPLMDNTDPDQWSVTDVLTYLSVTGSGGTTIYVDVSSTDSAFFKDDITQLVQDTEFTTENKIPFSSVNPSLCYDTASGKITNVDQTALSNDTDIAALLEDNGCTTPTYDLGDASDNLIINGLEGPDLLLQSDASQSFQKTVAVPEPGIIALLGLGLGLLGTRNLRSRRGQLSA